MPINPKVEENRFLIIFIDKPGRTVHRFRARTLKLTIWKTALIKTLQILIFWLARPKLNTNIYMCKISSFWGYTDSQTLVTATTYGNKCFNLEIPMNPKKTNSKSCSSDYLAIPFLPLLCPAGDENPKLTIWKTISGKTLTLRQRQGCGELEQQYSHSYKSPTYYLGHISTHKNVFKHNLWNDTLTHTSYHLYRVFFFQLVPPLKILSTKS